MNWKTLILPALLACSTVIAIAQTMPAALLGGTTGTCSEGCTRAV